MKAPELNLVPINALRREVGSDGVIALCKLHHWLAILCKQQLHGWESNYDDRVRAVRPKLESGYVLPPRMASSIVCRSEVELFGESFPRFCYRLLLKDNKGIVNIRRLSTLAGQLHPQKNTTLTRQVLSAPCIADAYFEPPFPSLTYLNHSPGNRSSEWCFISAPLAKVNGEMDPGEEDVWLIPYVRHMRQGGGMCAQAVCFMAAALHVALDAPVHGIPEITLIATTQDLDAFTKIKFDGLWTEEITQYLNSNRCGTSGIWQAAKLFVHFRDEKNRQPEVDPNLARNDTQIVLELEHALQCYLQSQVPVVMPVDVGRMQGIANEGKINHRVSTQKKTFTITLNEPLLSPDTSTIFQRNGLLQNVSGLTVRSHVVLLVGCSLPQESNGFGDLEADGRTGLQKRIETIFSFQDPAHFPFMQATAKELLMSTCYNEELGERTEQDYTELLLGWFLPVTPKGVVMPLLDEATDITTGGQKRKALCGIKSISGQSRTNGFNFSGVKIEMPLSVRRVRSEFRLTRINKESLHAHLELLCQRYFPNALWGNSIHTICDQLIPHNSSAWVWLEVDHFNVLVWDAEKPSIQLDTLSALDAGGLEALGQRYLVATFCASSSKVYHTRIAAPSSPSPTVIPRAPRESWRLKSSVISSFETMKSPDAILVDGLTGAPLEIYLFMQNVAEKQLVFWGERMLAAVKNSFGAVGNWRLHGLPKPNVRRSAHTLMANSVSNRKKISASADYIQQLSTATGSSPVAVATYLPGLCVIRNGINPAVEAVRFVLRVITELKSRDFGHSLKTVELVGGSRVIGPLTSETIAQSPFLKMMSSSDAVDNLMDSIAALLPEAKMANVNLALEFEPSSLCCLGSMPNLQRLAMAIKKQRSTDAEWNRVGFNLDIAHWGFLGRIAPHEVGSLIFDQIKHAHISTHTRGHFADSFLETDIATSLQPPDKFIEWLEKIESIPEGKSSGFVSLELECCKSKKALQESWTVLNNWLGN